MKPPGIFSLERLQKIIKSPNVTRQDRHERIAIEHEKFSPDIRIRGAYANHVLEAAGGIAVMVWRQFVADVCGRHDVAQLASESDHLVVMLRIGEHRARKAQLAKEPLQHVKHKTSA